MNPSHAASISKALALPDLPFDEYNLCTFTRWRPGEIFNTVLSLVYGTPHSPNLGIYSIANNFCIKDTLAFLIIVVSAKRRGLVNAIGVPSLFDRIVRDATMYFLAIFSSHALLILFEGFAPVSDFSTELPPSLTRLSEETVSTHPCEVSHPRECSSWDESDGVLPYS